MKHIHRLVPLLLLAMLTIAPVQADHTFPPGQWQIEFQDLFGGSSELDSDKWMASCGRVNQRGEVSDQNGEWCHRSFETPDNVYLARNVEVHQNIGTGRLYLWMKKEPSPIQVDGKSFQYSGAIINSHPDRVEGPGFIFNPNGTDTYYIEARVKMPKARGMWPAFWLIPSNHQWPPEIDIYEAKAQGPMQVLGAFHWRDKDGNVRSYTRWTRNDYTQWHYYGVLWSPTELRWYIDGREVHRFSLTNIEHDLPMYIRMETRLGGGLGGKIRDSDLPARVEVDLIRVLRRIG